MPVLQDVFAKRQTDCAEAFAVLDRLIAFCQREIFHAKILTQKSLREKTGRVISQRVCVCSVRVRVKKN